MQLGGEAHIIDDKLYCTTQKMLLLLLYPLPTNGNPSPFPKHPHLKLFAVDGFASRPISIGEVASLDHELWDDAMEAGTLEVKVLALGAYAFLTRAQSAEVFNGPGYYVTVQPHHDAAWGVLLRV